MKLKYIVAAFLGLSLAVGLGLSLRGAPDSAPADGKTKSLSSSPSTALIMNDSKIAKPASPVSTGTNVAKASEKRETAILGGGCFWGMEEILRKVPGVLETEVGYSGGKTPNPSYREVCTGRTGHAEVIRIAFDPAQITFEQLLGYFFRMHDPTTLNRQHNDIGTQYRSAIFFADEAQKEVAEKVKSQVDKSGRFKRPIVTEITKASEFYPAEDYHQKYLIKNPGGYNCHILVD